MAHNGIFTIVNLHGYWQGHLLSFLSRHPGPPGRRKGAYPLGNLFSSFSLVNPGPPVGQLPFVVPF